MVALAALAAAGAAVGFRRWQAHRHERIRVMVAVFANRTGDASLEPFGSMAADWVTRGLARTPDVEVVDVGALYVQGRGASGEPTDPLELARRNGAGSAVAVSYYIPDDSLIVRSAVVEVRTGEVLETVAPIRVPKSQSVQALDLLQQQVMTAVAGALDVEFRPFTAQPTPPPYDAYQAFVAGQTAYWQGRPATEARDFFQFAVAKDSTFLTAAVWLAFAGANGAGCALTDSVTRALAGRVSSLSRFDRLTLQMSGARCAYDWHRAFRLAAEQASLQPRSTYAVYTAGFFGLTSGRARAARAFMLSIDPEHELGWLSDSAKTVYWRDLTGAEHLLGDYKTELAQARRLERRFPDRGTARMIAARALAGLGRGGETLQELDRLMQLPADAAARVHGGLSPGVVAHLTAIELTCHGDPASGRAAAQRAIAWYEAAAGRLRGFDRLWYARSLWMVGRPDEALAEATVASRMDSMEVAFLGLRGFLAATVGASGVVQEMEQRLAEIEARDGRGTTWVHRARIAIARGDRATALAYLRAGSTRGIARSPSSADLHSDPVFAPLRGDSAFQAIERTGE
jgi:TolB-like protein